MPNAIFQLPELKNEPILNYAPHSKEKEELLNTFREMIAKTIEIPQYIGGLEIKSDKKIAIHPPFDHQKTVGYYYQGTEKDVHHAIDNLLQNKDKWSGLNWEDRVSIILKAADLISTKYRSKINASTMICQSKNCYQAEIDAACEFIDFLRFNAHYVKQIYSEQPISPKGVWNKMEYRPLEGFTYAVTPFNFTAIAANLPICMALMGNVVLWKPSDKQIYSAQVIIEILKEAGMPDGVINTVYTDPVKTTEIVFNHPDFSGIHYTGSTAVFQNFWKMIGNNIHLYKTYPRIVGETGGKDFVWVHPSADAKEVSTALSRGAFEFQGQKCSAASRAYIPKSLWTAVKNNLEDDINSMKMGTPEDFSNFINAVIDQTAFNRIVSYIERAKISEDADVIIGGNYDDKVGYFIQPTIILAHNPHYESMEEEIFGPVLSIYVYDDEKWEESLDLVNNTSKFALTGAIFAKDRYIINIAAKKLQNAAGNFYINDKPTGAVVGQQPFGGARASGTNDKAGSMQNLLRWVSVRTIKENYETPTDYRYPFLGL